MTIEEARKVFGEAWEKAQFDGVHQGTSVEVVAPDGSLVEVDLEDPYSPAEDWSPGFPYAEFHDGGVLWAWQNGEVGAFPSENAKYAAEQRVRGIEPDEDCHPANRGRTPMAFDTLVSMFAAEAGIPEDMARTCLIEAAELLAD